MLGTDADLIAILRAHEAGGRDAAMIELRRRWTGGLPDAAAPAVLDRVLSPTSQRIRTGGRGDTDDRRRDQPVSSGRRQEKRSGLVRRLNPGHGFMKGRFEMMTGETETAAPYYGRDYLGRTADERIAFDLSMVRRLRDLTKETVKRVSVISIVVIILIYTGRFIWQY
jgi:hypothetical protein